MFDPATKAPNFTRENAAEMARRSVVSRLKREASEKAEARQREIEALALALSREIKVEPDEARKAKVLNQIDGLLDDMKGANLKTRLLLGKAVAELWKLVQPTAGVQKPGRSRRIEPPMPAPTPQEPPATAPKSVA